MLRDPRFLLVFPKAYFGSMIPRGDPCVFHGPENRGAASPGHFTVLFGSTTGVDLRPASTRFPWGKEPGLMTPGVDPRLASLARALLPRSSRGEARESPPPQPGMCRRRHLDFHPSLGRLLRPSLGRVLCPRLRRVLRPRLRRRLPRLPPPSIVRLP